MAPLSSIIVSSISGGEGRPLASPLSTVHPLYTRRSKWPELLVNIMVAASMHTAIALVEAARLTLALAEALVVSMA